VVVWRLETDQPIISRLGQLRRLLEAIGRPSHSTIVSRYFLCDMASTAATLFPHSRHQNIQDAQIKTAGGDFYDIQINVPEPVPMQGWSLSRIIQYVSTVFQNPENRVALVHGGPSSESEGEDAHLREVRFPISALEQGAMEDTALAVPPNPSGSGDRAGQSEDRPGQPPDDCFVVCMRPAFGPLSHIFIDSNE
jgi:hypothetical protein